jgi:hypothetical protein
MRKIELFRVILAVAGFHLIFFAIFLSGGLFQLFFTLGIFLLTTAYFIGSKKATNTEGSKLNSKPLSEPSSQPSSEAQPFGVGLFGGLLLIGSLLFGFSTFIASVFGFHNEMWYLLGVIFFVLTGLLLSAGIFLRDNSTYIWQGIIVYLFSLLAFSIVYGFVLTFFSFSSALLLLFSPFYIFCLSFIAYFLTKKPRQYYHVENFAYKRSCRILTCIIVAVSVFLLLIQVFGVPFWWVFGFLNTQQDTWLSSSQFENPQLGENVSFRVCGFTSFGSGGSYGFFVSNSGVSIEPSGQKAYRVVTNEDGIASFVYTTDPTIITFGDSKCVVPAYPQSWLLSCVFASVGAMGSGLLVRLAFLKYFKKTNEEASFKPSVDNLAGP